MKVVEIFASIDGEGRRTGLPTTFIRLFGCNLHCSYCDTRYGCEAESGEGKPYEVMSVAEIVEQCERLKIKSITLTGGEPLVQPGVEVLIEQLLAKGYWVNIETNGSIDVVDYSHRLKCNKVENLDNLFFTVDCKCPSSGMHAQMLTKQYRYLSPDDVIKFVVGDEEDLDFALTVLETTHPVAQVYFSPVFGSIEPKGIVEYVLKHQLFDCKVQVQLHKIIWDPAKRGV